MVRHSEKLAAYILGCWLASLSFSDAASEFLSRTRIRSHSKQPLTPTPLPQQVATLPPQGRYAWARPRGPPASCNCQGKTDGTKCGGAAQLRPYMTGASMFPVAWPIPPPPPPPPMEPGPPPPLPPIPPKQLPDIPGMPAIGLNIVPTLGPPPLWKMTPPPTLPPPITTPMPRPTVNPFLTTPAWVETPVGLARGSTLSPWLAFTTPFPRFAPAPAPAATVPAGLRLLQKRAGSWNPLSFLRRTVGWRSQQQAEEPCHCPCEDLSSPSGVDRAFEDVMRKNADEMVTLAP